MKNLLPPRTLLTVDYLLKLKECGAIQGSDAIRINVISKNTETDVISIERDKLENFNYIVLECEV